LFFYLLLVFKYTVTCFLFSAAGAANDQMPVAHENE